MKTEVAELDVCAPGAQVWWEGDFRQMALLVRCGRLALCMLRLERNEGERGVDVDAVFGAAKEKGIRLPDASIGVTPAALRTDIPAASVLVCTRDRPESLARCLAALAQLRYPRYEVVVVDNVSRLGLLYRRSARPPRGAADALLRFPGFLSRRDGTGADPAGIPPEPDRWGTDAVPRRSV